MKIAIFSTDGGGGGAARAMQRLAAGLTGRGHHVDIIQLTRWHIGSHSVLVEPASGAIEGDELAHFVDGEYLPSRRNEISNTFFSLQTRGLDFSSFPNLHTYDVLNIHWVNYMLNPETIAGLIDLGRPIIFTLHDMAHFTGGCHYSAGCEQFSKSCDPCLQLNNDFLKMTRAHLEMKRRTYHKANVFAVAPSRWLCDLAQLSGVFPAGNVSQIWNGIETDIFRPMDKRAARTAIGVDPDARYILFGAHYNSERRKGARHLVAALEKLGNSPRYREFGDGEIRLLVFGEASPDVGALGLPITHLGYVGSDQRLTEIYNAANLLLLPSIEDNQPNVMMEAMACGLPVVAFAVGGMPDVITDGVNGRLVKPYSVVDLADAIVDVLIDPQAAAAYAASARRLMEDEANIGRGAARYEALFARLAGEFALAGNHHGAGEGQRSDTAISLPQRVASRITSAPVVSEMQRVRAVQREAHARSEEARRKEELQQAEAAAQEEASRIAAIRERKLGNRIGRKIRSALHLH